MLSVRHVLALSGLPGMTSTILRDLAADGFDASRIMASSSAELAEAGMRRATIEALGGFDRRLDWADAQIARAAALGARIVSYWDDEYPTPLREIYAPPVALFVLGSLPAPTTPSVAIVGTRTSSAYGRTAAERYAREFAAAGVVVVSGLARGIDTYAHASTLSAGGKTVAVVASGLDEIGPSTSAELARRIAGQGAVVSEYALGVKAIPAYFPQRNRIISGLCHGVVVVESDEKGGAMITASFAMDQNREVFAVPGPIGSMRSRGTNKLIRTDRARLTQTPTDVLDTLGFHVPIPIAAETRALPQLSVFEQRVLDSLDDTPRHIDVLSDTTGMSTSELLVSLLGLEFKGLARQMAGRVFLKA
jgi:DNA processing protein